MSPKHLFRVFLLAAATFVTLLLPHEAAAAPAERIYAGVYLHDVTKFDQKDGVFDVDLELWAKWLGDFDPAKLKLANAAEVERELIGEESDGAWHSARWRVKGTLRGEFPLHRFPFDEQTLGVVLELPERDGELVPDLAGSGMREHFSITGWLYEPSFVPQVSQETYRSDLGTIESEGRPTAVHRVAFEVTLRRPLLTAGTKLFVPLLVILLVALVALFVHPKLLDVRSGVGVTALLACFAFQFAVADTMPNVAYITVADILFLVAYGLTAALLVVSIISYILHERGNDEGWKRLDRWCLVLFPVALALGMVVTMWPPKKALATPPAAVAGDRPASSRPLLRVGIDKLSTPTGGLASRGANWGTGRTGTKKGTRIPVLVEQVPSITNDALVFLADGRLDVTWRLRPDLKWSDGKPLTASDFEFALKVSPDPRIDEIRVVSPSELVVRFKDRVAVALDDITPLPKHVLQAEFEKGGYEAVRDFRRKNVTPGTGPYKITEFVEDEKLVLEANEHFVGPAPSIAKIEILRFKGDEALVKAFESGAIDMIAPNAISPEAATDLAKRRSDAVQIRPSEVLYFLHHDPTHPLLSKPAVRKALLASFDRERIRREVFGEAGHAAIAHVPVTGDPPEKAKVIAYDAEGAKKALEAEGVAGQKIALIHGNSSLERALAAQLVKDAAAAGVTLEPSEVPSTSDVYRKRKVGGLLLHSTTGDRESSPEKYWGLPQVDGKYDRSFRNEAYDDTIAALVEREERALYPERRDQIRNRLFVAYSERLPSMPLLFQVDRIVAHPELNGWEDGSGTYFGRTIEQWYFEKPAAP